MEFNERTIKEYARVNAKARRVASDPQAELALIRLAKAGDVAARNTLIEAQLLGLYRMARCNNYTAYRGDATELVDVVALHFDEILEKFDETRGLRLYTYLFNWARSEMGTELMGDRPGIRVPANIFKEGRADEVARCIPGTTKVGEGVTLFDTIKDPNADVFSEAIDSEHRQMVKRYMETLDDTEKYVIQQVFFSGTAMSDLAKALGLTTGAIRKIRDLAIAKMSTIAKAEFDETFDLAPAI